jgi:hypothetical protein
MTYNILYYFLYSDSIIICLEIVYKYESIFVILFDIIFLINTS